MALSIPELPNVTVWMTADCQRAPKVLEIFRKMEGEPAVRILDSKPPRREELEDIASYIEQGPKTLMSRSVARELGIDPQDGAAIAAAIAEAPSRLRGPLVVSDNRRAIVARPPELCLHVLVPQMPEGEDVGSFMRKVIRNELD